MTTRLRSLVLAGAALLPACAFGSQWVPLPDDVQTPGATVWLDLDSVEKKSSSVLGWVRVELDPAQVDIASGGSYRSTKWRFEADCGTQKLRPLVVESYSGPGATGNLISRDAQQVDFESASTDGLRGVLELLCAAPPAAPVIADPGATEGEQ